MWVTGRQLRSAMWRLALLSLTLVAAGAEVARPAEGQPDEPVAAQASSREERLAKDFTDPLTSFPQLFVQNAYTPSNFGTKAQTNRVVARLIVPRIPRLSLFPFPQLVRPTMTLVTVPTGRGSATRTELGDSQLFDLLVLPGSSEERGLLWGFGPVFVFPTATDNAAGQGAWQVGPAAAAIYKKIPGVLLGGLVQNPISFAYTNGDRPALSTLLVQPIVLLHVWRGFYVKSADASWAVDWRRDAKTFPLSFGVGYVIPREDAAPLNLFVAGEWMAYRDNAPFAPQTTIRFGMTVGLPDFHLGRSNR